MPEGQAFRGLNHLLSYPICVSVCVCVHTCGCATVCVHMHAYASEQLLRSEDNFAFFPSTCLGVLEINLTLSGCNSKYFYLLSRFASPLLLIFFGLIIIVNDFLKLSLHWIPMHFPCNSSVVLC